MARVSYKEGSEEKENMDKSPKCGGARPYKYGGYHLFCLRAGHSLGSFIVDIMMIIL